MTAGTIIAIIGAATAAILGGLGSAIGVQMGGRAATGVLSEKPELFGKMLILQALPGTQGIYGFLIAFLVMVQLDMFTAVPELTTAQGWAIFGACMPIAVMGLLSAILQGRTAVSAIHMVAKQPDASVKGMTMTALVETYAILTLLISILLLFSIEI